MSLGSLGRSDLGHCSSVGNPSHGSVLVANVYSFALPFLDRSSGTLVRAEDKSCLGSSRSNLGGSARRGLGNGSNGGVGS